MRTVPGLRNALKMIITIIIGSAYIMLTKRQAILPSALRKLTRLRML